MATPQRGDFSRPDDTQTFEKGTMKLVDVGGRVLGCGVFEPGWRWSEHLAPRAGTASCQQQHIGYVVSGRLGIRMDDGAEAQFGPGDAFFVPAGHDGWTEGGEQLVLVEFQGEK